MVILLNEYERKEFEHHKKVAEEQLNQMYFGSNKHSKTKNGLEMPPFLVSPNKQQKIKEPSNSKSLNNANQPHSPKNNNNTAKNGFMGSGNLLNLLNFKNMNMDNDRLIILAICLLLNSEDVDELLILALIYIML